MRSGGREANGLDAPHVAGACDILGLALRPVLL